MKKIILITILLFLINTSSATAFSDPLSVPNNKIGIHILFPEELDQAASLVNSNGGDWGYVTIPIQAGDRNIEKWQSFMDKAKSLHIIPILRLATEGDYFNTTVWRKPTEADILDFANFLNSLNWPTKNRYIIVFNEPNRGDEWEGLANPAEYATLLHYAASIFKQENPDFFIISAGLDNAAASSSTSFDEFTFLNAMQQADPQVFSSIDGIGSHSYPNPGFSKSPNVLGKESIATFSFEESLLDTYAGKQLPVFITETGWSQDSLPLETVSSYYNQAFATVWDDKSIVAVTPFLLRADVEPFSQFSLIKNGQQSQIFNEIKNLPKIKGNPAFPSVVLAAKIAKTTPPPEKKFNTESLVSGQITIPKDVKSLFRWFLGL